MSTARLGRGTKSKVFLYICCILVLGTVIYIFHGTQSQLEDVKKAASICSQQQESLSAQLQVIFEYKLRLEKSLQKEKSMHRQDKEKLLTQLEEEKQLKHKDNLEYSNKYNTLQEKYDLLQTEHKSLNDELTELKNKQMENNEAQQELKKQAEELKSQVELIKTEKDQLIEKLKTENEELNKDKQKLINENEQMSKNFLTNDENVFFRNKNNELVTKVKELTSQLQTCTVAKDKEIKLEENAALEVQENQPMFNENQIVYNKISLSGISSKISKPMNTSTTPIINPQAVQDHDNNHDNNNNHAISSAKPLADPLMKAVIASVDDNAAAEEDRDKLNEDQDKMMPPDTVDENPKETADAKNPNSGSDVIAAPPLNN